MSGHINVAAMQIHRVEPSAIFVQYFARCIKFHSYEESLFDVRMDCDT